MTAAINTAHRRAEPLEKASRLQQRERPQENPANLESRSSLAKVVRSTTGAGAPRAGELRRAAASEDAAQVAAESGGGAFARLLYAAAAGTEETCGFRPRYGARPSGHGLALRV